MMGPPPENIKYVSGTMSTVKGVHYRVFEPFSQVTLYLNENRFG